MSKKTSQFKICDNRIDRLKKISNISPKEIFYICQNYLAESADALLGRQRRKYPPSMKIPPDKESQFFPLIWASEIRGMSTEALRIERAIIPMMNLSGNPGEGSYICKIIREGEDAVKSLCRKIQLEISGKEKFKNGDSSNMIRLYESKNNWNSINDEFGITKKSFGKKINFISDKFKREIIFRDIEHSFILASQGFYKPAVILAGGVVEELLRLYLEHRNISPEKYEFNEYIKTCETKGYLKKGTSSMSNSVRHFRNLVHLAEEKSKRYTISKSTAKNAVGSIFTIANDF